MEIRNIAIIAHVDHGKTSLTDAILRQTGAVAEGITMDSNELEQERGITIYSKNASFLYRGSKVNIVDTPGHADFSSEVERVLRAIDAVILVVDAVEGPMPQTKFVLKKSLELGLVPILVINKIDKKEARPAEVHEEVLELFLELNANDRQLSFATVYASAKAGYARFHPSDASGDLTPLFDTIIQRVSPAPADAGKPLRFQPFNLAYDNFLGRLAIGRVYEGQTNLGQNVFVKTPDGQSRPGKITKLFTFSGLARKEAKNAEAGDIVMLAGLVDVDIGDTVCGDKDVLPLPAIAVDEPTIVLGLLVNNSPFAGRAGKFVTSRQIKERLMRELEVNVGLKIDFSLPDQFKIYGRGELHIAVLLENMRREGYELQVSQPQVITKRVAGRLQEPFEEVIVDAPEEFSGAVIENLGKRRGVLTDLKKSGSGAHVRLTFNIPTRGLLGFRQQFLLITRGEGILTARTTGFADFAGDIERREFGSMVSMAAGKALAHALDNLQQRGVLYIKPGEEVYQGMIIGSTSRGEDLTVNPIKGKHLTNVRSAGEEGIQLKVPLEIDLEKGLELIAQDEFLEVTPKSVRLRKKLLSAIERVREKRQKVKPG
ncbi:MAG: translational GTPase TypA [Candidatus Doudnabacteria bacterium]|nr:translational GTPase TypA [Candidatus Doudnabacteria bacterium]